MRARIGDDERRARLGIRHRLAPGTQASSLVEAAASLVVLHATDAAGVYLQAQARVSESSPASIGLELHGEPTVLRQLAMRRTLFIMPLVDVPIVHAAASRAIAEAERKRTVKMLTDAGIGPDPAALLQELAADALAGHPRAGRGDDRRSA